MNSGYFRRINAFTFVEIVFVVLLSSLVGGIAWLLYSSSMRQVIKGTDRLDSIRVYSELIEQMRKDVANAREIKPESIPLHKEENTIPVNAIWSSQLEISLTNGCKVAYSLKPGIREVSTIHRSEVEPSGKTSEKNFAIDRTHAFEILQVGKLVRIGGVEKQINHVLIRLTLDSNDPRFPSNRMTFDNILMVDRLPGSDWQAQ